MRILLADDQEEIRMLTQQQLESHGHRVVAVGNGEEALRALRRQAFDIVLLDEEMPVMSGTQVLQAIRTEEMEHPPPVVIALTGYNTDSDRDRLLQAGFNSVIGKPFRLGTLDAILHISMGKEPPRVPENAGDAVSASTEEGFLNRVGGDRKLLQRMIQTFLRDGPQRLKEIRRAIRQKQGDKLASLAHALKGPLGIFGANRAAERCQELQEFGRGGNYAEAARRYDSLKEEIALLEANLRGYAGQKSPSGPGAQPKTERIIRGSKRKKP